MELIIWIMLLIGAIAISSTAGAIAAISAGLTGKIGLAGLFFSIGAFMWCLVFTSAPFSMVLN